MEAQHQDMNTLAEFTANPGTFLERLKQNGQPVLLTVEGKPELIVQDADSYLAMMDRLETIAAVREGLEDMKHGRHLPARDALKQIAKKHNLSTPLD